LRVWDSRDELHPRCIPEAAPYFIAWGLQVYITKRGSVSFGKVKVYRVARNVEVFALHRYKWPQQLQLVLISRITTEIFSSVQSGVLNRIIMYKCHGTKRKEHAKSAQILEFFSVLSIYYIQAFFTIWSICFFRHDWWYLAFFFRYCIFRNILSYSI